MSICDNRLFAKEENPINLQRVNYLGRKKKNRVQWKFIKFCIGEMFSLIQNVLLK